MTGKDDEPVLCDGGLDRYPQDPNWEQEHLVELLNDQLRRMEADAFFSTASTATEPSTFTESDLKNILEVARKFDIEREDLISMFVITRLVPVGSILKCRYEGKWYALINRVEFHAVISAAQVQPVDSAFGVLSGIPVVEDDDLARKILEEVLKPKTILFDGSSNLSDVGN